MLTIHNSLGRTKQEFVPLRPGEVRMYVCGMTVYDYCHLGHARMLVVFDMVRALAARAAATASRTCATSPTSTTRSSSARSENGEPIEALTERFIRAHERGLPPRSAC